MRRTWSELGIIALFVTVLILGGFAAGWGAHSLETERHTSSVCPDRDLSLPLTPEVPYRGRVRPLNF